MRIDIVSTIRDQKGVLVSEHEWLSDSFVKNFLVWIYYIWCNIREQVVEVDADMRAVARGSVKSWDGYGGMVGDDSWGMVVGTGTDLVGLEDYKLQTQTMHGCGAGEMEYGDQQWTHTGYYYHFYRQFMNNSGSPITVYEAGLYGNGGGVGRRVMHWRDVYSAGEVVLDGYSLSLSYLLQPYS